MTDQISRDVLPIPDAPFEGALPFDAKDPEAAFPPIEPLRPPADAPNVLVILLDDVGFASSSAFGGPCATPTAERLAGNGLKYTAFIRRRSARRPEPRCSPAATTTRSGWGSSPSSRPRRPATARSSRTRARRSRKHCC